MSEDMSSEEVAELIARDKKSREVACMTDIRAALEKHRCKIVPVAVIREDKILQSVEVTAL